MNTLASQCAQHCIDARHFADSGEICSSVVFLGRILTLVLAQEMQDNRPQHLIRILLVD